MRQTSGTSSVGAMRGLVFWRMAAALVVALGVVACTRFAPAPMLPRPAAPPPASTQPPPAYVPPPPSPSALRIDDMNLPPTHEETNASGITLRHVQLTGVPMLHIRIVVPGGFASDGKSPGLAALTARTMLEDALGPDLPTRRKHGLERIGEASVRVERERTVFSLRAIAGEGFDLEPLVALLRSPGFRQSSFQRASQALERAAVDEHRLDRRRPIAGDGDAPAVTQQSLSKIKAWHCRAFHRKHYGPNGVVVVMVGDTSLGNARAFAVGLGKGWKRVKRHASTPGMPAGTNDSTSPTSPSAPVTSAASNPLGIPSNESSSFPSPTVVMVIDAGTTHDEDGPALWLVSHAMGTTCGALPWTAPIGSFRVCAPAEAPDMQATNRRMHAQLSEIAATGLSEEKLEAAKQAIIQEQAQFLRTPSNLADALAQWQPATIDDVGKRVRGVTDVRPAVQRLLDKGDVGFFTVGPASR